ncbi:MAG: protein translocase subunit SecD [Myxococcales bacterium]|nr:MAG: protein translocase subunit SecD [Myxococcales bacterium]
MGHSRTASGRPAFFVSIDFKKPRGANLFEELTERNVKRRMAIVLDDRVESAPVIQTKIGGGRAQITLGVGPNIQQEAKNLSIVLKAGALPVPIRPSNEQLIGPTLGQDSVQRGAKGAMVGIILVLIFMLLYYQVGGFIADVMVLFNISLLLAFLSVMSATLTLPGIAGIALTVGMAVDANVLIMERIREELRGGKSARAAVDQGYRRAFWSIMDAQLTTFIAGVVLYQFGTGPIRGFAVTLMAGIITSLFYRCVLFSSNVRMVGPRFTCATVAGGLVDGVY